jgi:hypothetical protein
VVVAQHRDPVALVAAHHSVELRRRLSDLQELHRVRASAVLGRVWDRSTVQDACYYAIAPPRSRIVEREVGVDGRDQHAGDVTAASVCRDPVSAHEERWPATLPGAGVRAS